MNSLIIISIAIVLFILGYRFYARRLEALWQINPKRETPAYSKYDSVDYIPAKNWLVLFGHHFASIAGRVSLDWVQGCPSIGSRGVPKQGR